MLPNVQTPYNKGYLRVNHYSCLSIERFAVPPNTGDDISPTLSAHSHQQVLGFVGFLVERLINAKIADVALDLPVRKESLH